MNRQTPAPFRIQLAVDGSEYSMAATELIRDLPLPPGTQITILGVVTPGRPPDEDTLQAALANAEKILAGSRVETQVILLQGQAAKKLIEYGNEHHPDLMVLGAKGKGLYAILEILLGGTAHQIFENARWPVLVVRAPYRGLKRVLLTTDGSQASRQAAQYLARFPLPKQTKVQVLHVKPLYPSMPESALQSQPLTSPIPFMVSMMPGPAEQQYLSRHLDLAKQKGQAILAQTKIILESSGRKATTFLRKGDPASEILEHSRVKDIDLIVAGPRGLKGLDAWGWDSVSRKLVDYAKVSVLFVRSDLHDKDDGGDQI
jgi:nucleotide-binding universal stress UspA family protein